MDIISKVVRVAKAALDEINKPESYVKGDKFEAYIRAPLFILLTYSFLRTKLDFYYA